MEEEIDWKFVGLGLEFYDDHEARAALFAKRMQDNWPKRRYDYTYQERHLTDYKEREKLEKRVAEFNATPQAPMTDFNLVDWAKRHILFFTVRPQGWVQAGWERVYDMNRSNLAINFFITANQYGTKMATMSMLYLSGRTYGRMEIVFEGPTASELYNRPPLPVEEYLMSESAPIWPPASLGFESCIPPEIAELAYSYGITFADKRKIADQEGQELFIRMTLMPRETIGRSESEILRQAVDVFAKKHVKNELLLYDREFTTGLYHLDHFPRPAGCPPLGALSELSENSYQDR